MSTTNGTVMLAAELRKAGLPDLAIKAERGVYSVVDSTLALPELELARDLQAAHTPEADTLARRCVSGEFGPTDAELDTAAENALKARYGDLSAIIVRRHKNAISIAAGLRNKAAR